MNTVNILGTEYTVNTFTSEENNENAGLTDFTNKTISLLKGLNEYQQATTFLHEIVHAYMHESGLDESSTSWVHDESLMVWLSIQIPKIIESHKSVNLNIIETYTSVKEVKHDV